MIKQLKYILNSFDDEDLDDIDVWIDSNAMIEQIVVEKLCRGYAINLITNNAEVVVNGLLDKERKDVKHEQAN